MPIGAYQESAFGGRIFNQGLFEESATQKERLGTIRVLDDGRRFVYCKATAAAIAAGVAVSKNVDPQDLTIAAADAVQNVIGAQKLYFTLTGTPTLNLYQNGLLVITAGNGIGEMYKVRGNSADDNPATGRFTVYTYDPLKTAHVTATTTASIFANPYDGVLINPAVADGDAVTEERILGVTVRPVTASYYFWAQTWGLAAVLLDVDAAAGAESDEKNVMAGITAGRLGIIDGGAEPDRMVYGSVIENADLTNAEANLIFLMIS